MSNQDKEATCRVTGEVYELVTSQAAAEKLGRDIFEASYFSEETILGTDCEGWTKECPLALMQVSTD